MDEAEIIQSGAGQAVKLPREYRFRSKKAFIKKLGNAVLLIPEDNPWQGLLDSLDQFSPDFMVERDQPEVETQRETLE